MRIDPDTVIKEVTHRNYVITVFDVVKSEFWHLLDIQIVKVKVRGIEKYVMANQYLELSKSLPKNEVECMEQVVVKVYYKILDHNEAVVSNVEVESIPVCIVDLRFKPPIGGGNP